MEVETVTLVRSVMTPPMAHTKPFALLYSTLPQCVISQYAKGKSVWSIISVLPITTPAQNDAHYKDQRT